MLLPRASDLEEEPTIDLNKVLEYARNITECPIYVGSLPKWTFKEIVYIHHITLCCVLHQYANGCTL